MQTRHPGGHSSIKTMLSAYESPVSSKVRFRSSYSSFSISPEAYRLSSISSAEYERLSCTVLKLLGLKPHIMEPLLPLIMKQHRIIIKTGTIHQNEYQTNSESYMIKTSFASENNVTSALRSFVFSAPIDEIDKRKDTPSIIFPKNDENGNAFRWEMIEIYLGVLDRIRTCFRSQARVFCSS